jgi:hypothetical protein
VKVIGTDSGARLKVECQPLSAPGRGFTSRRRRDLGEGDPQVHPGQVRADAAVRAGAERDVPVPLAGRVESVWVPELGLVRLADAQY